MSGDPLTKAAAGDVARQEVRINAVCSGPVDTRMIHSLEPQLNPADPVSVGQRYQSASPLGRYVMPEEIANIVLVLCPDLDSAITGRNTWSMAAAPPPAVPLRKQCRAERRGVAGRGQSADNSLVSP